MEGKQILTYFVVEHMFHNIDGHIEAEQAPEV